MPVIDESQVRAACEFNQRRNIPQTLSRDIAAESATLSATLADLQATADHPLREATTLPAAAYTSEAFYRWENGPVLRAEWQCVAHTSQLAGVGDFITLELLGEPLVIARDKDQGVRAFSRTCPHRGMDIMPPGFGHGPAEPRGGQPDCGNTRLFLCPYHSWTFNLDGQLKGCPEMHEATGFERADWGLREFRAAVWQGFIFVNLDGAAPRTPAEQWAEMGPHLKRWASQDLIVVDARLWECPFNWKVIVENFMESYHHAGAHSQSLQPMMPARDTWTEAERAHFVRCHLPYGVKERGAIDAAESAGGEREVFPLIPGLTERDRFEWGLTLGFPHWLLAYVPDCLIWYRAQPEGPHRHTLMTTLLLPRATTQLPDFAERLKRFTAASVGFHLEDMEMCIGVQRGYYSSGYRRGRLSHLEMPIWLFQRYLAARARETWPTLDRPAAQDNAPNPEVIFSLAEKVALVTGGTSGIGRAIALRFREAGAQVLIVDRTPTPDDFAFVRTDVSSESEVAAAFDEATRRYGRLDIAVNNAGIQPLGVGFDGVTGDLLARTFGVNVHGVAFGIKHAARVLADGGRVINTASFVGMIGTPGGAAYSTSKAAVIHLTRLGAIELARRRITVNAISPGTIRTPAVTGIPDNPEIPFIERRTPLGRLGEPEEVAALAHFLASDEAAYITGQNIAIDGRLTAGWTDYDLVPPANVREGKWIDDP